MKLSEFIETLDSTDEISICGGEYETIHSFEVKDIDEIIPSDYDPEIERICIDRWKWKSDPDSRYRYYIRIDVKE